MGEQGNLFLDAPKHLIFERLCKLAKDHNRWKALTRTLDRRTAPPASSCIPVRNQRRSCRATNVVYNEEKLADKCMDQPASGSGKTTLSASAPDFSPTIPTRPTDKAKSVKLLHDRKIQKDFFRPVYVPPKPKKLKKAKKKTRVLWTDKQRQAEAHAHYIIHHGSATDAVRFLRGDNNTDISAATTDNLRLLAAKATKTSVPTWSEAAALIFSSSDDSLQPDNLQSTSHDSSLMRLQSSPLPMNLATTRRGDTPHNVILPSSLTSDPSDNRHTLSPRSDLSESDDKWATAAPRPDLNEDLNVSDDDGWAAAAPRPDLGDISAPTPDLNTTFILTPVVNAINESYISAVSNGNTDNLNETINFMSPISKSHETHQHQWTPVTCLKDKDGDTTYTQTHT